MRQQKQQQKLDALIRELERDLSEGKSQIAALEETHERLRESERICQELADENRRLGEEITGWRNRFATSEENQRQLSMLRQQLEALQAEHARVLDSNTRTKERLTPSTEAERVSSAIEDNSAGAVSPQSDMTGSAKTASNLLDLSESGTSTRAGNKQKILQVGGAIVRNWRTLSAFVCVIALMIVGAVTNKKALTPETRSSRDPVVFMPEAKTPEALPKPVSKPVIKTTSRVRGVFQTVRPTAVFSRPTEDSELVANISKGMKVNVVDSKDGWLEIHSKHGRPPGFIRQEATVRIGAN